MTLNFTTTSTNEDSSLFPQKTELYDLNPDTFFGINSKLVIKCITKIYLTLKVPKVKIVEFANSVDPDEVAHNEPPHLDLHYLPSSFLI